MLLTFNFRLCAEQTGLKVETFKGVSVCKALVLEASLFGASNIVLGIIKKGVYNCVSYD
jgi:hypothetical protein